MEYLLAIGVAMFAGLFLSRLTSRFNLPDPGGVALGMSVTAAAEFGAEGAIIRNIILFSLLIYELVGPLLTKTALTAAEKFVSSPPPAAVMYNLTEIRCSALTFFSFDV